MVSSKLLTVVVPVYKVEKYINKCLDSLVVPEELMGQLEVIVINDGTPDNSAVMAREYEKRFPQVFRMIDKENGGHGSAWNLGVKEATGKYLRFLDSDDWLSNFSDFMVKLSSCDSDLVLTDVIIYHEDTGKNELFTMNKLTPMKEFDANTFHWNSVGPLYRGHNFTNFHACTYKTALLKEHQPLFLERIFYDDEILMIMPLCVANTFIYFDLVLYHYLLGRVGQTMDDKIMRKNLNFMVKSDKAMITFYANHPVDSKLKNGLLHYILNTKIKSLLNKFFDLPFNECKSYIDDFMSFISNFFPTYNGGVQYKLYRLSYPLCWMVYHYLRPIWAYFKINILKK